MTYAFATKLYSRRVGLMSAVLLGTSLEYWYLGHAVITDMTLWVTVSATLMSFYAGYESGKARYYYLAFAAAALPCWTRARLAWHCRGSSSCYSCPAALPGHTP